MDVFQIRRVVSNVPSLRPRFINLQNCTSIHLLQNLFQGPYHPQSRKPFSIIQLGLNVWDLRILIMTHHHSTTECHRE